MEGRAGPSLGLVDLVKNAAVSEVGALRFFPSAEDFIHTEELDLRKIRFVFREGRTQARAVKIAPGDVLALRRPEPFEVRLRDLPRAVLLHNLIHECDRRLGKNADRWRDDLKIGRSELLLDEISFIFPRQ